MSFASFKFSINTFIIKVTKWVFLIIGVSAVCLTVAWPYVGDIVGRGDVIKVVQMDGNGAKSALTALNTQILGRDKEQRLVEINAEQATPSDKEFTNVGLEKPKAEMALANGESLAVESVGGTYDRSNNQLLLEGDVKLTSSDGYDIQTQAAKVSLANNSFETDTAVKGFGPTGTMEAEGMEVDQTTGMIILKGKSKLVFDMKAINQQKADKKKASSLNDTAGQNNEN